MHDESITWALGFIDAVNVRKPRAECRREEERGTGTGRQLHRVGTAAGSPVGIFQQGQAARKLEVDRV